MTIDLERFGRTAVSQGHHRNWCVPAAVLSVLRYLGEDSWTSLEKFVDCIKSKGFNPDQRPGIDLCDPVAAVSGYRCDRYCHDEPPDSALYCGNHCTMWANIEGALASGLPVIVAVVAIKETRQSHMVVVLGIEGEQVDAFDPGRHGCVTFSKRDIEAQIMPDVTGCLHCVICKDSQPRPLGNECPARPSDVCPMSPLLRKEVGG